MSPRPLSLRPHLDLTVRSRGDGLELRAAGELDLVTAPVMKARLEELGRARRSIVVDLHGITFIGSTGLSVLLEASRTAGRRGNAFWITRPSAQVTRVLEASGLTGRLPVLPLEAAAR